jgi:hypothetical protein
LLLLAERLLDPPHHLFRLFGKLTRRRVAQAFIVVNEHIPISARSDLSKQT